MWAESTREGRNPIWIRSGFSSVGTEPDESAREDYRVEGRQDPWSALLTPGEVLSSLNMWQHAQSLASADVVVDTRVEMD
eukprot:9839364-Alexandrium_andersonii.AAC.1